MAKFDVCVGNSEIFKHRSEAATQDWKHRCDYITVQNDFLGKLTVKACKDTWGTLWFTLFMMARMPSLGLKKRMFINLKEYYD